MTQRPRHVVVIGNGMVGARFAEEAARRDPAGERVRVTVVGAEAEPAYNRVLLPRLLAGDLAGPDLLFPAVEGPAVTVRTGVAATAFDPARRRVDLDDGDTLHYDELVLATGSRAALPPVDGLTADGGPAPGASTLRDLADCRRVLGHARPGAPVAVLGGGLLGLETARALAARGARVTVVEPAPRLMPRQLDAAAAAILAVELRALGVDALTGRTAARWEPGHGLLLDDGRLVAADSVVVAAGVRAATELACAAGLAVDRGILVDDALATSAPRVHAIGDCAQHPDGGAGLVQPGWEQAAVLADLLTGSAPHARYRGGAVVTRLKAEGVELTSLGEVDAEAETLTLSDPHGRRYAKLSVRSDRVVGAILLGFPDAAATITQLFDLGAPVPADRLALLLGRALPEPAAGDPQGAAPALVCRCNGVTRDQLSDAWRCGARTREALAEATRATTGCGGCVRDVNALLAAWDDTAPVTVPG
ncbi:FAD-dependent oxidoreductase [Marinitenerispora sediminis]|uniref:FAD/NAD(P)-binding oxidoreductase n=1 Tax=Marinitenerispora sediminis TaxID=1931232 RepID=A0A368T1C1_9ACTN|nr:FAD-dependent oxidoreductase [Marinitenerispora sediminis]RCV53446.1 FAD/NAD(P)-binding oxidoreductase [Marinitenerispora sediminis]RCV55067.1 FAD/NAD(P)-binding oxidoreductase [Marinitenerispora sediminis]RCV56241.1 FAD/NAD(P)-binding oxidoreductase [Marinitenerispora sediminis]